MSSRAIIRSDSKEVCNNWEDFYIELDVKLPEVLKLCYQNREGKDLESKQIVCPICEQSFDESSSLERHQITHLNQFKLKLGHLCFPKSDPDADKTSVFKSHNKSSFPRNMCTDCALKLAFNRDLIHRSHRRQDHDNQKQLFFKFSSFKEFKEWRKRMEEKNDCELVCQSQSSIKRGGKVFFRCYQTSNLTSNVPKIQNENRSEEKKKEDVLENNMLEDFKKSEERISTNFCSGLDKKVGKRHFLPQNQKAKAGANEKNIDEWFNKMLQYKDGSPVLFYKKHGETCENLLEQDDFMLVLMTHNQINSAKEIEIDSVCLRAIQGTLRFRYSLVVIVLVDFHHTETPIAFCISNKIDEVSMLKFFLIVREKLGRLTSRILITDNNFCYATWLIVMGTVKYHFFYSNDVLKCWRKKLSNLNIEDTEKNIIYQVCLALLREKQIRAFCTKLYEAVKFFEKSETTKEFGLFFQKHYASCADKWASCFRRRQGRKHFKIGKLFKLMKKGYLKGVKSQSLGHCVRVFLRYDRLCLFKKLRNKSDPSLEDDMRRICSEASTFVHNIRISNDGWIIQDFDENFEVINIQGLPCSNRCNVKCSLCSVCIHEYECTCYNFFISTQLCRHIHAVGRFVNNIKSDIAVDSKSSIEFVLEEQTTSNSLQDLQVDLNLEKTLQRLKFLITSMGDKIPTELGLKISNTFKRCISEIESSANSSEADPNT